MSLTVDYPKNVDKKIKSLIEDEIIVSAYHPVFAN